MEHGPTTTANRLSAPDNMACKDWRELFTVAAALSEVGIAVNKTSGAINSVVPRILRSSVLTKVMV